MPKNNDPMLKRGGGRKKGVPNKKNIVKSAKCVICGCMFDYSFPQDKIKPSITSIRQLTCGAECEAILRRFIAENPQQKVMD